MDEDTRQLVASLKTTERDGVVRSLCATVVALLGFVLAVSLSSRAPDAHRIVVVPDDVDLVAYPLPKPSSLAEVARELWADQVSPHEVLRYNPSLAITDVDTTLETGTVVTLPNHRDFPVEALAAVP